MMKITDEMVVAANNIVPSLQAATVRQMLEAAMEGQVVFVDGVGEFAVEGRPGKTQYPVYLQVLIGDSHRALEYAQTLLAGASHRLRSGETDVPITLMMAGDAEFSE